MRITSKACSAITAMLDLAVQQTGIKTSLQTIASRHNISVSYLEHLFSSLRRHELVRSVRGPGGGYVLARAAHTISIADIVKAVDRHHSALDFDLQLPASGGLTTEARIAESFWASAELFLQSALQDMDLQSLAESCRDTLPARADAEAPSARSPVLQRPKSLGLTTRPRAVTSVFDLAEMDS